MGEINPFIYNALTASPALNIVEVQQPITAVFRQKVVFHPRQASNLLQGLKERVTSTVVSQFSINKVIYLIC